MVAVPARLLRCRLHQEVAVLLTEVPDAVRIPAAHPASLITSLHRHRRLRVRIHNLRTGHRRLHHHGHTRPLSVRAAPMASSAGPCLRAALPAAVYASPSSTASLRRLSHSTVCSQAISRARRHRDRRSSAVCSLSSRGAVRCVLSRARRPVWDSPVSTSVPARG